MPGLVGRAIGGVVNPVVHNLDIDDIVERIDVNALLDRIDMDVLLEKIDLNRVLDRVDMDRILDRVDIDKVVDRSNIGDIVSRSTNGVLAHILDAVRAQMIRVDQAVQGWARLSCFRPCCGIGAPRNLPPRPGSSCLLFSRKQEPPCPHGASKLALAVQGRNAGFVSRTLAFIIDRCIIIGSYTLFSFFAVLVIELIVNQIKNKETVAAIEEWNGWIPLAALVLYGWQFTYEFCSLATVGRTIGKAIMGLLVVSASGNRLRLHQAFLRTCYMSIPVLPIMVAWIALIRKDRRQLGDLVCCTAVVYAWDARQFRSRERLRTEAEKMEPFYDTERQVEAYE